MCGFVGYTKCSEINHDTIIKNMTDTIIHRGPDSDGFFDDERINFGFRRLSILDLSEKGNQPMISENGNLVSMCNGEIYNYKMLREELIEAGYKFNSRSDSEVILHGFDYWKEDILTKLRGMFAFCVWDKANDTLFIARDPFGIKPMYYTDNTKDGSIIFGSEIKSFLPHPMFNKELNKNALKPYLTFQYSLEEETFFKGVYKLLPGHYIWVKDGNVIKVNYFQASYSPKDGSLQQFKNEIKEALSEVVTEMLQSDVPVGTFLSGGIDSSLITSIAKPDMTFSVGFKDYDGMYNETVVAKELCKILGIQHHTKLIDADDCLNALPTIQYHMDEPQSNLSSVPLYFLAEFAKQHVTVVLSGEGADELFGGYFPYRDSSSMNMYKKLPFGLRRFIHNRFKPESKNHVADFLYRGGRHLHESFVGEALIFTPDKADEILTSDYRNGKNAYEICREFYDKHKGESELTKKQLLDINFWMPGDILLKGDKMSSAHGLEIRIPFLDPKVMDVASKLPDKLRVNGDIYKYALRETAKEMLPDEWANRKKVGFPVPIRFWLREEKYYNHFKEVFNREYVSEFFNKEILNKYLDDHYNKKALNQRYIWTVYVFLQWYKVFFIDR